MTHRVRIRKLPSGVKGLDAVLGGGLPELSFNIIAGSPGCGKTTLAHQIMFANATADRPALYFTIFGEPPLKMLRYQQQYSFFDASKVDSVVRFIHLGDELLEGGLLKVLARIEKELQATEARTVIVDSFRSISRAAAAGNANADEVDLERFVQLLALTLTAYEATTFLIGEYSQDQSDRNPVFTVADGILWLSQTVVRNSSVRQLQVVKMRGQGTVPGLHTMKMSDDGIRVYPRLRNPEERPPRARGGPNELQQTGIVGLDAMLGGGVPAGYSLLVVGPSGSGKTMMATQFILEGIRRDEPAVIAIFEKRPEDYLRTSALGVELDRLITQKKIGLAYIRPLDLSIEEALEELEELVKRIGAKRVVIDSLSGLELALAPSFRDDFRESLYRMVGTLTNLGVTVLMTVEVTDSFTELRLSPHGISFLTDGIVLQRYFEDDGEVRKAMTVIKMRGADHRKELREYTITGDGIVVGSVLSGYRGILRGVPVRKLPSGKRGVKVRKNLS